MRELFLAVFIVDEVKFTRWLGGAEGWGPGWGHGGRPAMDGNYFGLGGGCRAFLSIYLSIIFGPRDLKASRFRGVKGGKDGRTYN